LSISDEQMRQPVAEVTGCHPKLGQRDTAGLAQLAKELVPERGS
jgi:hypothetical protein